MKRSSEKNRRRRGGVLSIAAVVAVNFVLLLSVMHPTAESTPSPLGIAARIRGGGDSGGGGNVGMVLRVRLTDGSVEKVRLEEGTEDTLTLGDVLKPLVGGEGLPAGASVRIGARTTEAAEAETAILRDLAVRHGTMITVLPPPSTGGGGGATKKTPRFVTRTKRGSGRDWDPYPDLAKDYEAAVRQAKTMRSSRSGNSYADLSKLRSTMHAVDPQKDGALTRLYMCKDSAERFYSNGVVVARKKNKGGGSSTSYQSRCGLLLGTVARERVDRRARKSLTSLSSQTADEAFCTVAKVQAVWEPPGQNNNNAGGGLPRGKAAGSAAEGDGKLYDSAIASTLLSRNPRVLAIARYLDLVPVGWIFSYQDDRLEEENDFETDGPQALFGLDVAVAGTLKARSMKDRHDAREEGGAAGDDDDEYEKGDKFATLAMDATTGATEAFQLSDVAVQMVHEGIFETVLPPQDDGGGTAATTNPPKVPTKHPVVVDGRETRSLDSVLCLINTAVLSHTGTYGGGGGSAAAVKKSNGSLTNKTKKKLARALASSSSSSDHEFLEAVCDFGVLLALDDLLATNDARSKPKGKKASSSGGGDDDMKTLCGLVRKWARGQKKGTTLDPDLKRRLRTYLDTP